MKKTKKMTRAKLVIILFCVYAVCYAISNTMMYKMNNDIQTYQANNELTQNKIDLLQIEINTKDSREKIVQEHPELQIHDNVYYLQPIDPNNE